MRKVLFMILAGIMAVGANAQEDKYVFNHLAIGAEVGTTGIGLELATPLTHYVTFRTGFTVMPSFSFKDDVNYTLDGNRNEVKMKATTNIADFKLLADLYPFKNCSFHLTGGFYAGRPNLMELKNTEPIIGNMIPGIDGIAIGDAMVTTDANGIARANLKVNSFKPYVGLGFGRAVSKHRVNVAFDMGIQFWGSPKVEAFSPEDGTWQRVHASDVNDDDINKALDKISKWKIYPVLSLRVYCRIL
ncbi:MAG: hypothetical protein IJT90_09400 [Bacteroidaceae bacterium]|nr:hypothetical protein [Bacteroidaceae bacterium]